MTESFYQEERSLHPFEGAMDNAKPGPRPVDPVTSCETKIKTSHDFPPIPDRHFDWSAWVDGTEETGPYGHGPTEAEAIVDLKEQLEEI